LAAGAHERVIHAVLDAAPDAARHKDHRGLLPLHYVAAFGGTPWPVVAKLIKMFPDSVRATTADGDTPLHLLMSNGAKFLRQQQQSTSDEAVCLDRNTTKLAELLMGNDATIMATNGNHQSPSEAESSKTVEDLPPLLMMNQSELNPLHVSACFDAPPQLIKILLDSVLGPKAAFATTSLGSTPLHLACAGIRKNKAGKSKSSKRLLAVVEALATPEACAVRDSLGRTPLMLAVQNKKADRRVIRALVRALPASIEHRTANGYLPLHLAVQSKHCRDSVIKTLIAEYPKSIFEKTVKGDTALHEACLVSKIPYDVVELLVRKYPGAVDCENDSLELPIDRARAMGLSKKICTLLLETSKNNKITAKPKKEKNKSTAVKVSSAGNAALRAPDGSTKTVGFFVPQLQGPSSRQRRGAAPDPPAEDPSTISRSTDPTPMRRRDVTPEAPRSLLGPVDQHSRRTNVVPASQLKPSPERRRGVSIVEPFERTKREGRSVDRRPFAARRAMSVTHDPLSTSSLLGFSCQRARTRSPTRRPLVDASTPKPVLERRTKSEANMQPPIARKRVTRLSKDESTSAITKGDVYRFEI
jgi:ankyrin repeat protein